MKRLQNQKGVAMVMALSMVVLAIVLANIVMTIMLSHGRLTRHQVGRIEAYYAGLAGINMAIDRLMASDATWMPAAGGTITRTICNNCGVAGAIQENSFAPATGSAIDQVNVTVRTLALPEGAMRAGSQRISAVVTYQNPG